MISEYWNSVVQQNDASMKPRTHIRASELGYSHYDRFLKMMGVTPTNGYTDRVLRIFDAGKVVEFIVMRALAQAGILNKKQDAVEIPETADTLRISGQLDATIGGFGSWDVAEQRAAEHAVSLGLDIDGVVSDKAQALLSGLRQSYPDGWTEEMVVECKSINSQAFHHYRKQPGGFNGYPHNRLQLYAYLLATGLRQGILLYVSKDDFSVAEVIINRQDPDLADAFNDDVRKMTMYVREQVMPARPELLVYNRVKDVYELNWAVTRSPYLSVMYGYANADELEQAYHQELLDINRAIRHIRAGKVVDKDLPVISKYNLT